MVITRQRSRYPLSEADIAELLAGAGPFMVDPYEHLDRSISSLERRLRTMQLDACIPQKEAASTQKRVSYAFRAWRAHPHIPSWHVAWLRRRGFVRRVAPLKEE